MKKMLMVATVPSMIGQFNMSNIYILQKMGYEVHIACDFEDRSIWTSERIKKFKKELEEYSVKYFQIDFARSPLKIRNHKRAYIQLKKLYKDNKYSFVHCHTPVASVICRMVSHKMKTKCIYTAHGFHFYDGTPIKNWIIFYPIEKFFSRWTDVLITINQEDYKRAKEKFYAKRVEYIPGIGIDTIKFNSRLIDVDDKRSTLGISDNNIMLLSVGELSIRKNHEIVIRAVKKLNNPDIRYFICGKGELEDYLKNLISELGLNEQVRLLGYRMDVSELYQAADLFVFPSHQEGLPVALMEAIACQVPVICSKIRGNIDIVKDQTCLFNEFDADSLYLCIKDKIGKGNRFDLHQKMKISIQQNSCLLKKFDLQVVSQKMKILYQDIVKNE